MPRRGVVRAGISLPEDLMEAIDILAKRKGYKSRSQAIGEAIRVLTAEDQWESYEGEFYAVISFVYDHEVADTANRLIEAEHRHTGKIISTMHIHIDERNCLEISVVKGDRSTIEGVQRDIAAAKGVKILKVNTFKV
ncbi:MAG: nickel-responsive transcriptional regulator NikR [Thermoproteota archaeon]|jgi:CopG family nickel-responsive transcriptional regulator|uniref:Putative nickel-responsive regulator n=1 Tax=Candidatus Methanodesulfokora washburnensis TaxID=2478471 RepID=A0A429GZ01_9CREN|nr:nickel-responsive transcriptional regulator NikR [Candidatus Methanodesulfokores washburnensis]RSN79126.1 nickel-responsive transcriptional regulator NikR [Candidatus Methanodesulfokores washburnensis]TDA42187.1 MAG: nickel-responsive transcriptional regulator NikR [Candidatus Korarchaeota archaeon]